MILQFVSSGSCAEMREQWRCKRQWAYHEDVHQIQHQFWSYTASLTDDGMFWCPLFCSTSWWNKLQYHIYSIHQLLMSFGYNLTFVICSVPAYCISLFIPCLCAISSFDFDVCWRISLCFIECVIPIWDLHADSYGIGRWYAASCTSAVCVVCLSVWCIWSSGLTMYKYQRAWTAWQTVRRIPELTKMKLI